MIQTTEAVLDQVFKDKDVLLVGNSVELMNYEYGDLIDSYETVVRFGKGIETNDREKIAVGRKTDVWVTGEFRSHMLKDTDIRKIVQDVPILYNTNRWRMDITYPKIDLAKGSFDMFTDEELLEIFDHYNITDYNNPDGKRLSAGILTIMFMCKKIQSYKSLTLIGFDFFAKITTSRRGGVGDPASWYRPILGTPKEVHDHNTELNIVQEFIDAGQLEWKILSDLNDDIILNSKYGKF